MSTELIIAIFVSLPGIISLIIQGYTQLSKPARQQKESDTLLTNAETNKTIAEANQVWQDMANDAAARIDSIEKELENLRGKYNTLELDYQELKLENKKLRARLSCLEKDKLTLIDEKNRYKRLAGL